MIDVARILASFAFILAGAVLFIRTDKDFDLVLVAAMFTAFAIILLN